MGALACLKAGGMKTCTRCKTSKPPDDYGKHGRSKDGLQPWCQPCRAEQRAETKDQRSAYQREFAKGYTVTSPCEVCGAPFEARIRTPRVRTCPLPECRATIRPSRILGTRRELAERRMERAREGIRTKRLWVAGGCSECGSQFVGQTRSYNTLCSKRCASRVKDAKRRARKRQAGYEPVSRIAVLRRDNFTCYLCGVTLTAWDSATGWVPTMATLDHVIPLAKGGAHSMDNLRACCAGCNSAKSDTL